MLATKTVTLRMDLEDIQRFDKIAQKLEKTVFGAAFDTSFTSFMRRAVRNELDRLETKVANSTKV
ncbi:conserved hypothetical protein [Leptospira interrogans serovar Manilae]|uniref:Uncharacterized protein n=1 Tax=Leptospira interrogans serovar Manilae TaxID=214675 RepID=A0AAQ1P2V2_LEPIR|nr:hypothetical protein [Leptospira interrogans]AKP25958.1 hypothetical protein LIMLP_08385 [Leptospira interrogans serovar Manilae]AKP29743.1 hypothetical protein LIMHP_08380 [Leptospira interrogans serovar Manilae]EYU62506.1 hypothetical protein CI00_20190 [Leptospira interrogans serovar Manilae]SOR63377.1 conserved hypothetical protein [Leptospira interrogans serovar Manilae]